MPSALAQPAARFPDSCRSTASYLSLGHSRTPIQRMVQWLCLDSRWSVRRFCPAVYTLVALMKGSRVKPPSHVLRQAANGYLLVARRGGERGVNDKCMAASCTSLNNLLLVCLPAFSHRLGHKFTFTTTCRQKLLKIWCTPSQ